MNEEVFLSALREDPTDEVTWFALADWLEDDCQTERAELLRLTLRLRGLAARRRGDAGKRVNELIDAGVRPVVVERVNSLGMRFALVPPGRFLMGSPKSEKGRLEQEYRHEVHITKPYWLGVFPVTQAQWRVVMGSNPSSFQPSGDGRARVEGLDTDDFPVERVSWGDTLDFLQNLTDLPAEVAASRSYLLPSEAQWEHACRGFGAYRAYHFGECNSYRLCNFIGSGLQRTTKVGSYPCNSLGLYDMHGNVWEWCLDAYESDYYESSPREDPCNSAYGRTQNRVIRGGAYFFQCEASSHVPAANCESTDGGGAYYGQCRSASREGWLDSFLYSDLGFRAVLMMES